MIAVQQPKYPKSPPPKQPQSDLLQKSQKLSLSKLGIQTQTIKDLHPAFNNTFIFVDINSHNNIKRVLHVSAEGLLLGQLVIKEVEYVLFMLSPVFVNLFQYTEKKVQSTLVQWNLLNYQTICVNLNREILPMVKVFAFSQSSTFCIIQCDQHTQPQPPKQQQPGSYHTKFKLSYFKHPLRKTHQKPYIVFKTHTNPKEYGYHQQIIKLNNHSMIGSISNKMDQNDQTCLKTFDFRNVAMGIEVNYKFHVQIQYRKEVLGLWVTDIWEIRPEHFYLKCQIRVDKAKQDRLWKTTGKLNHDQNLEQCLHLTWAYKNENTIKFAKFKTPLLNTIQFLDGFKQKQRSRIVMQKSVNKEKVIYPTSMISHLVVPGQSGQILGQSTLSHLNSQSNLYTAQSLNLQNNQLIKQPIIQTSQLSSNQLSTNQLSSNQLTTNQLSTTQLSTNQLTTAQHSTITSTQHSTQHSSTQHSTQHSTQLSPQLSTQLSTQLPLQSQPQPLYTPTYIKSLQPLPTYYINNTTQQITLIDRQYNEWQVSYPAYYPTMTVYFRPAFNIRDNEKILEITMQKKVESFTVKQLEMFMLEEIVDQVDGELGEIVGGMLDGGGVRMRDLDVGWAVVEGAKQYRETKSKSNYQSRQYKC